MVFQISPDIVDLHVTYVTRANPSPELSEEYPVRLDRPRAGVSRLEEKIPLDCFTNVHHQPPV
jgi:hypothetical protein